MDVDAAEGGKIQNVPSLSLDLEPTWNWPRYSKCVVVLFVHDRYVFLHSLLQQLLLLLLVFLPLL